MSRANEEIMKYIWIDFGMYLHKSVFAWRNMKTTPPTYLCTTMILGDLRKIGVDKDDKIIIACDTGRSWRKDKDPEYKNTRKAKREAQKDIPWKEMYDSFNDYLNILDSNTPFHIIQIWGLEADDVIAYGCRYFKDNENVILSVDADFEQLFALPNVKIYSPHSKKKCYKKPPKNPYKIIESKIRKEVSDDLISKVETEEDYKRRFLIINLLSLPEEVESKIKEQISFLPEKEWDIEKLPFRNLHERFKKIYEKDKVITFEKSMKMLERKQLKKLQIKNSKKNVLF